MKGLRGEGAVIKSLFSSPELKKGLSLLPLSFGSIRDTIVVIRGAGEQASAVAHCLFRSGFKVCLIEAAQPLAVRRMVSFCEAVYDGQKTVEGVTALSVFDPAQIPSVWDQGQIPLAIDPEKKVVGFLRPHVLVDAILAKRNVGTTVTDAPLVIALGPGFTAPTDAHVIVETNRGHNLGRLIFDGRAEPNTGIPGMINGFSEERVFRAPCDGLFIALRDIGAMVCAGDTVAQVAGEPVIVRISGVLRGMLRDGITVTKGLKAGDVDPRGKKEYCATISDKARALGGAVLSAILGELPKKLM